MQRRNNLVQLGLTREAMPLAVLMLLAGCGPLISIGSEAPPPALLTLENPQPPTPVALEAIVAHVDVPADYASVRIVVKSQPTLVEYLPGVQWIDRPERLLRQAAALAYAPATPGATTRTRPTLYLTVKALNIVASGQARSIRVALDARLPNSKGVGPAQCTVEKPLTALKPLDVSSGFNSAIFECLAQLASWLNAPQKG